MAGMTRVQSLFGPETIEDLKAIQARHGGCNRTEAIRIAAAAYRSTLDRPDPSSIASLPYRPLSIDEIIIKAADAYRPGSNPSAIADKPGPPVSPTPASNPSAIADEDEGPPPAVASPPKVRPVPTPARPSFGPTTSLRRSAPVVVPDLPTVHRSSNPVAAERLRSQVVD
jgi:hypothetical protein